MRGSVIAAVVCALACSCGPMEIRHGVDGSSGDGGGGGGGTGGAGGGGGGNSGSPTFGSTCKGASTTITGTITAPNGHDPVANAFAYIPLTTDPLKPGVSCELCNMPLDGAAAI